MAVILSWLVVQVSLSAMRLSWPLWLKVGCHLGWVLWSLARTPASGDSIPRLPALGVLLQLCPSLPEVEGEVSHNLRINHKKGKGFLSVPLPIIPLGYIPSGQGWLGHVSEVPSQVVHSPCALCRLCSFLESSTPSQVL